jgi:hypothetical protein
VLKTWYGIGRCSARDHAEVLRCRGDANRRRFAVQLCTLRAYGRFLPEVTPAPVTITNHLARQLDLPLVLFGDIPERLATETEQLQRIREYLGWQPFDDAARMRLTQWLTQRATDDVLPSDLVERAEHILRAWQIVVPAHGVAVLVALAAIGSHWQTLAAITGSAHEDRQDRMGEFLCGRGDAISCVRRVFSVPVGSKTESWHGPRGYLGREHLEPHQGCARSAFFYDPIRILCADTAPTTVLDPRKFCQGWHANFACLFQAPAGASVPQRLAKPCIPGPHAVPDTPAVRRRPPCSGGRMATTSTLGPLYPVFTGVRLSHAVRRHLDRLCEASGLCTSAVVRQLITEKRIEEMTPGIIEDDACHHVEQK